MSVFDKLKSLLDEADFAELQESIQSKVDSEVKVKLDEMTDFISEKAQMYVEAKEVELKNSLEKQLTEQYEKKLMKFEGQLVESLDRFLDSEISSKISSKLIKQVAINETYQPLVDGIVGMFDRTGISMDKRAKKLVENYKTEIVGLKVKINEQIKSNIETDMLAEQSAIRLRILESTKNLSTQETGKVLALFEGKSFDQVDAKVDQVVSNYCERKEAAKQKVLAESKQTALTQKKLIEEAKKTALTESRIQAKASASDLKKPTQRRTMMSEKVEITQPKKKEIVNPFAGVNRFLD